MNRATRSLLLGVVALTVLVGCSSEGPQALGHRLDLGGPRDRDPDRFRRANPSAVIAAELAFARLAQEKGQWTAFLETSTGNAVMFVPQPVNAHEWLRRQTNPPEAVRWQPHQVWSSCDGTLAVTKGAWQRPDGSVGYFTTVWERQRKGEYKWVMDQGDTLTEPLAAPDLIGATAATCGSQPTPPTTVLAGPADKLNSGASRDGTLRWHVVTRPDGSRVVGASYWDGTSWQEAIDEQVAAG